MQDPIQETGVCSHFEICHHMYLQVWRRWLPRESQQDTIHWDVPVPTQITAPNTHRERDRTHEQTNNNQHTRLQIRRHTYRLFEPNTSFSSPVSGLRSKKHACTLDKRQSDLMANTAHTDMKAYQRHRLGHRNGDDVEERVTGPSTVSEHASNNGDPIAVEAANTEK